MSQVITINGVKCLFTQHKSHNVENYGIGKLNEKDYLKIYYALCEKYKDFSTKNIYHSFIYGYYEGYFSCPIDKKY